MPANKDRQNVADKIVMEIQKQIINGQYQPGEKLEPERQLAKKYKVNRTSLREAIKRLEQLNLVKIRQGDGTTILDYKDTGNLKMLQLLIVEEKGINIRVLSNILEMRRDISIKLVEYSSKRRNREHLESILAAINEMEEGINNPLVFQQSEFKLYEALADATKNIAYFLILSTIKDIYIDNFQFFRIYHANPELMVKFYRKLFKYILNRQTEAAVKRIKNFLQRNDTDFINKIKSIQQSIQR